VEGATQAVEFTARHPTDVSLVPRPSTPPVRFCIHVLQAIKNWPGNETISMLVTASLARPARLFILPSEKSSGNETSSQLALRPHPSQLVNFELIRDKLQVFPKTEILLVIYALAKQLSVLCTVEMMLGNIIRLV